MPCFALLQALAQATGRKEGTIKTEYDETGDLGVVAVGARSTQRTMFPPKPLDIPTVSKGDYFFARRGRRAGQLDMFKGKKGAGRTCCPARQRWALSDRRPFTRS